MLIASDNSDISEVLPLHVAGSMMSRMIFFGKWVILRKVLI